ncbi:hypothetical protein [Halalkalirubrum salinum]|uniref:hypothetical protein n=1 Tax=Halalkalirubrum salinum TaxID=2563889 RepID=UPI0010FBAF57|nr:hypothetical protein [Halalkalirubrum salinum]
MPSDRPGDDVDREVDILQLSSDQAAALGDGRPVAIHTGDRSIFLVPESVRIFDALAEIDAEVSFEFATDREVLD